MNQYNYPNSSTPSKAFKRGRMELYGCNNYGTGTYPRQQRQLLSQQQRPPAVLCKSHSASEAIFSSRHPPPDHVDMHNGDSWACGHYMPTPKRSRSVGSPSVLMDDYSCSPQAQQQQQRLTAKASCPAVVTPSRGLCAHFPRQQQQQQQHYYYDNHYYYGNGAGAPLDSDSFASRQHVKLMNHEERIPTIDTAAVTNKIHFDPFHIGVQQVTPSNSCDHGDSLRSLPRLDFTEDAEEQPLLQTSIPDLFEPYDILDKDGVVCPDIIEPYNVDCNPVDEITNYYIANTIAPDDISSTLCYDAVKSDGDIMSTSALPSARSQEGLFFSKEHKTKISNPKTVKKRDDRTVLTTAATATENDKGDAVSTTNGQGRFRDFHEKKWNEHLKDLREFKKQHGHCLVPHTFPENQSLARWVKRQRRQYKLMQDGDPSSTMTQHRVELLNREGFVWDSHEVVWRERYEQLLRYKEKHGHCRVPSYCKENPQLATWVKCQRRQYKLFWEGKRSSMSVERTQLLEDVGFVWEVRSDKGLHSKDDSLIKLADILNDL